MAGNRCGRGVIKDERRWEGDLKTGIEGVAQLHGGHGVEAGLHEGCVGGDGATEHRSDRRQHSPEDVCGGCLAPCGRNCRDSTLQGRTSADLRRCPSAACCTYSHVELAILSVSMLVKVFVVVNVSVNLTPTVTLTVSLTLAAAMTPNSGWTLGG